MTLSETLKALRAKVPKISPKLVSRVKQRFYEEKFSYLKRREIHKRDFAPPSVATTRLLNALEVCDITLSPNRLSSNRITTHCDSIEDLSVWLFSIAKSMNACEDNVSEKHGFGKLKIKTISLEEFFTVPDGFGTSRRLGADSISRWVKACAAFKAAIELKAIRDPEYLKRHSVLGTVTGSIIAPITEGIWNSRSPV